MTVVKGLHGSNPNFFFAVDGSEIDEFAIRYAAIADREDYERFVGLYGIRRTHTRFRETADRFQDHYARQERERSGLFDLNRYRNRQCPNFDTPPVPSCRPPKAIYTCNQITGPGPERCVCYRKEERDHDRD